MCLIYVQNTHTLQKECDGKNIANERKKKSSFFHATRFVFNSFPLEIHNEPAEEANVFVRRILARFFLLSFHSI